MIDFARVLLIADDDADDRFMLTTAFQTSGMKLQVREVADGQEAVDYITGAGRFADRKEFPFPALVVLDLKMPRMNGFEVLEWLRGQAAYRCLPVLVLSGSNIPGDVGRCYSLGANTYFVKPSELAELERMALAVKTYWCDWAEYAPDEC